MLRLTANSSSTDRRFKLQRALLRHPFVLPVSSELCCNKVITSPGNRLANLHWAAKKRNSSWHSFPTFPSMFLYRQC
ncbi:hypothetical protein M513_01303 [Trichuris suis]|uniref:Uncharacterized protein n=1 Tax=Trichuris suis TaxID=68888 RepID=A0A085MK87_9BILA|nr:hypothetical protein M513_01303 [Trichuris suis]